MPEEKTPLPAWARLLIAMFFAGLLLSFILLGLVCYQFGSADAAEMTRKFVGIEQLPPGFRYEKAVWLPPSGGMVSIIYDKDKTTFMLMKVANPPTKKDVVKALRNDPTHMEGPLDVTQQNLQKVGDKDFTYLLGTVSNTTGEGRHEQLRGGALVDDGYSIVKLTAETPDGPLNMGATRQFLSAMKKI